MSDREQAFGLGFMGGKSKRINQLLPYSVTLLSVALALGINLILGSLLASTPLQLFFLAVMVSAWLGGLRQGVLATVLSTLAVSYFFTKSRSLDVTSLESVIRMGTFVVVAVIISWLNQSRKTAQQKAEATLQALRQSEARFGSLTASNIIGMSVFDLDGLILEANDAFLKLVGYTPG